MTSLICGSLAFDTIMSFHGRFSEALLADQLHKINVAFLVPDVRREYGGCAGNIAYNLKLLNGDPLIMATLGQDGAPYVERLNKLGISTRCIRSYEDAYTAQAFITTDESNNQITAFHPGAMSNSHHNKVQDAGGVKLAIIAPDGRDGMIEHARDCAALGIPFIFDPGQGLPMFSGEELKQFIEMATYVAVNNSERVSALVVTRGEQGAEIFTAETRYDIPVVKTDKVIDPTGCGDAFRAGMLFGLTRGMDWMTIGRLASLMGAIKIESQGGQNHAPTVEDIEARFEQEFGYRFV